MTPLLLRILYHSLGARGGFFVEGESAAGVGVLSDDFATF